MASYLVEVIEDNYFEGLKMPIRGLVHDAGSARAALSVVMSNNPDSYWPFMVSELKETIPDVLWEAADGSMIMIAVRKLP